MSIELCSCNYPTPNGLVNDANTTFEYYVRTSSKSLIWIHFCNLQIGINTRIDINPRIYEQFPNINKNWMPIEQKIVEIQIGNNIFHIIKIVQFPIKLATWHTIHCTQGLTLTHVGFDHGSIIKHGLSYTTLSWIQFSKHLYLFFTLSNKNFQLDSIVK
jgi:hypothetical protein